MDHQSTASPLETPAPNFSLNDASVITQRFFDVTGRPSPLDSERDQNFRIASDDGRSFLLKISNAADEFGAIEMQTLAMIHIRERDPGLPVMQPLLTLDGGLYGRVDDDFGRSHLVRLFTFLSGRMWESTELRPDATREFGSIVARMGLALRGFFHPAGGYRILWDLKHTSELRPLLEDVDDRSHRNIAARVLDRFDDGVAPTFSGLRAQLIHNDLTLDNVLLDDSQRVSGIVDFGDLTHTALICDLAIALVSVMWGRTDPLEVAETAIGGYAATVAIDEGEAEVLCDLVTARLAALALIAAWRVRRYPENAAYITANVDLAWDLLERLNVIGFEEVSERMRRACMRPTQHADHPPAPALLERRRRVLGPALAPLSYDRPLYIVRAEGSRMFDDRGASYLDAYNNVPVVGHSHPRVAAAIAEQSRTLNINTRYLHESVVELAERLVATMPQGLDTVMFVNSGSEANDIAWRLATTYTRGTGGIVTTFAYHGVTTATIALSPEEWAGDAPEHIATVPPPNDLPADAWVSHIEAAAAELTRKGIRPAAFYVDSMFTSDGIFPPRSGYLAGAVQRLHDAGGLVVADEVQCGFGRTGSHMWSFEASGVNPDFVTLGKPMGNGHPVAAVVTRAEIAERFAAKTDMFSTFGGNPVASRAALAVLDVIEEEGLQQRAAAVGARLRSNLDEVMDAHGAITEVRGTGLMIGMELVGDSETGAPAPDLAHSVMNDMKERGVLIGTTGPHGNVLKIRPPLVLTLEEADLIADTLDASLRFVLTEARI